MARAKCSRTNKDRYSSKLEADLAVIRVQNNSKHHRKQKYREVPTRSYECPFCRGYHMTSEEKNEESPDRQSLTA